MTYGTFTKTYLVGRKIVPFVIAPAEQNHSDRRRAGDPAQEKGTYGAYRAFRAFKLAAPPNQPQRPAFKNEPPRDQLRLRSLKISHPLSKMIKIINLKF
jgi:hypothetical protein